VYWANDDHWAFGCEPEEICAAGWGGKTLRAENGAERPWVSSELSLEVVCYLLRVARDLGQSIEAAAAQPDTDVGFAWILRSQSAD